jgi:nitrogen fixation NifU-like protein
MKYETESCLYCEASASLLSQKIKNMNIKDFKNDLIIIKKKSNRKNIMFPRRFSDFKKLLNSDNLNRFKCVFLPIDAVLKALKL